jgi:hypothetical protein
MRCDLLLFIIVDNSVLLRRQGCLDRGDTTPAVEAASAVILKEMKN